MISKEEIKQKLSKYYYIALKVESLTRELAELENLAIATGGFRYDSDKIISSPRLDAKFTKYAEELVQVKDELTEELMKLLESKKEVKAMLELLEDDTQKIVLEMRYINHCTWELISEELFYDFEARYVFRIHNAALEFLEEKLNSTQKYT